MQQKKGGNMKSLSSYKNPFYRKSIPGSKPVLTTDVTPMHYKGYLIYKRLHDCFDIVKNGVCVGMNAGLKGAKKRIDEKKINIAHTNYNHVQ